MVNTTIWQAPKSVESLLWAECDKLPNLAYLTFWNALWYNTVVRFEELAFCLPKPSWLFSCHIDYLHVPTNVGMVWYVSIGYVLWGRDLYNCHTGRTNVLASQSARFGAPRSRQRPVTEHVTKSQKCSDHIQNIWNSFEYLTCNGGIVQSARQSTPNHWPIQAKFKVVVGAFPCQAGPTNPDVARPYVTVSIMSQKFGFFFQGVKYN